MVEDIMLKNTYTDSVLELSQDKTPYYVLAEVDWGQIQSEALTIKYLNQIGETVDNIQLGTRDVYVIGWVVGRTEDDITRYKDFLNSFVNPQQALELHYRGYKITFNPSNTIKYGIQIDENNRKMCKFKIDGVAHNPTFTKSTDDIKEVAIDKGMFHFPLIINDTDQRPPTIVFGTRIQELVTTIINNGQLVTGFKLLFTANGYVTNPVLYNIKDQTQFLRINKELAPGEVIEINTMKGERSIFGKTSGATEYSNYAKYRDFDNTWLQLFVGENIFRYDADSGVDDLDVLIYYNDKYLEVQQCF